MIRRLCIPPDGNRTISYFTEPDYSDCEIIYCEYDIEYGYIAALSTKSLDCPYGFSGTRNRTCDALGNLYEEDNTCTQMYCESTVSFFGMMFPRLPVGDTQSVPCQVGYSGTLTLTCTVFNDGSRGHIWPPSETCTPVSCPREDGWPRIAGGQLHSRECDGINGGFEHRRCQHNAGDSVASYGEVMGYCLPDECTSYSNKISEINF